MRISAWDTCTCVTCTWMGQATLVMDESWYVYRWVMSHMWMSHVARVNESCHTCEWVMSHTMNESCHTCDQSCHTHEREMSCVWHTGLWHTHNPTNEDYHVPEPIGPATLKFVDSSVESHTNDYYYLYTLPPMNLIYISYINICYFLLGAGDTQMWTRVGNHT